MVKPLRDLDIQIWEQELQFDFDKQFLLEGIRHGFDIITEFNVSKNVVTTNHPSAQFKGRLYDQAHAQILTEIENGNYVFADNMPLIISPLGVIEKPDGGVRLIHDCSRPEGSAVNDLVADMPKQRFQTLEDAAKLVTPKCFMAKIDLKSAYRSVRISDRSQQFTGLKWTFPDGTDHILYDRKLPFGAKLAPSIFHRLSQSVRRMMSRKGFTIIAYLDDFFLCETTQQRCLDALNTLLTLLCRLGFLISWGKVIGPTQKIVFLGVEIDSTTMELRLPHSKLQELKHQLITFTHRMRASKKQLQSLAGKLNWAAAVVHGGRVFLRRIINRITQLKQDWHKTRITGELLADITWWQQFMSTFNGKSIILDNLPITSVATDACTVGGGGIFESDWFYVNWEMDYPKATKFHINELESFAVYLAAKKWAPSWRNKRVVILCDNATTVASINKCSSRNYILMGFLRELFWISAFHNFHLKAIHVPGACNILADNISRLHDTHSFVQFIRYCLPQPVSLSHLQQHMSSNALNFLLSRHTQRPRPVGIG